MGRNTVDMLTSAEIHQHFRCYYNYKWEENLLVLTPDLSYRLLHSASDASVGTMCSSFAWMHNYYYFVSDVLPPVSKKYLCALAHGASVAFGKDHLSHLQLESLSKYCVTVWINLFPSSEL